jgi:predicted site-specific integrase-resolvase
MNPALLKTLPEAARELGIPVATLRRAEKRGDIPSYKSFSNRIRVSVPEVMAALRAYNDGGAK